MRIGIIDADLVKRKKHRFPNLACMKISSYYKKKNYIVKLLEDISKTEILKFDKVFISKVFLDTAVDEEILQLDNVEFGGTGFFYDKALPLSEEIEHSIPDYSLYDDWVKKNLENGASKKSLEYYTDYSIGFTTRGCIRQCPFCVNKNYKQCTLHSNLEEFVDEKRKYICLLDDNVLACKDWRTIFDKLNDSGKRFQFKQGMDERLLTDEKCEILFNSKWIGDYLFAFDNIKDRAVIEEKLNMIKQHTNRRIKFYLFCAFNHDNPETYDEEFWKNDIKDLFERIRILMTYQARPYVMRYKDYQISPYRGMYINICRWCNQPNIFTRMSFREFCVNASGNNDDLAPLRYMNEFAEKCPEIADKYFDIKFNVCDLSNPQ